MTDSLQKFIAEKRKASKKFKLSQLTSDYNSYVDLKRTCEREIRKRKLEYEVRISHEAKKNPKLFFDYIRNKKKKVRNNIGPILDNDKLISDDKYMASILNSTFSRVFTEEDKADIPTPSNIFQGPDEEKLIIPEI